MSTKEKPATDSGPKVKESTRNNQRAILDKPVKFTGELPVKKSGGRKSLLAPVVETLKADPGVWYVVADGKTGTVGQTRVRIMKLDENIQAETHRNVEPNAEPDTSKCYARYVAPVAAA